MPGGHTEATFESAFVHLQIDAKRLGGRKVQRETRSAS